MGARVPGYRFGVNPGWECVPSQSAVVRAGAAGDYHTTPFTTTLSLKSVSRGAATWSTPGCRYLVHPGLLVLLNEGQSYTLDIDAADRTGTLALFFEPGLVEDVARGLAQAPDVLEPNERPIRFEVCERLHRKDGAIARHLAAIEAGVRAGMGGDWLADPMLAIAAEIVRLERGVRCEMASFPGLRASTREEAYRRLHRARDFLDSSFRQRVTVATLARVACLSPFHFQRRRDALKVLFFDGTGMAIFYKRLDRGTFSIPERPSPTVQHVEIDDAALEALLDGVAIEDAATARSKTH